MNPLTSITRLWRKDAPPAPTPELSCFVKGVIHSIATDTANWRTSDWFDGIFTHVGTELTMFYHDWSNNPTGNILHAGLADHERRALGDAILKHLIEPARHAREVAAQAKRDQERAAIQPTIDHFAKLGCPDSQ